MAKPNRVAIALVVDRSGSMQRNREEAQGALDAFIADQSSQAVEILWTIAMFDHAYELQYANAITDAPPEPKLYPRGYTALLDAVGKTVDGLGKHLAAMDEDELPDKVIVVIITDGFENASTEYTQAQIRRMVERQRSKMGWEFITLMAGIDQFTADVMGARMGMADGQTVSVDSGKYDVGTRAMSSYVTEWMTGEDPAPVRDRVADEDKA